jgi:Family of unknown function (DUF6069)
MSSQTRELAPGRVLQGALIAAVVGAVLNAIVYTLASAAGVSYRGDPLPSAPTGAVALKDVVGASVMWVIPATIVLLILNRFVRKPTKVFVIIAVILGVLSLGGPLTFPGATLGTKLALCMAHGICAVVITTSLVKRGRAV